MLGHALMLPPLIFTNKAHLRTPYLDLFTMKFTYEDILYMYMYKRQVLRSRNGFLNILGKFALACYKQMLRCPQWFQVSSAKWLNMQIVGIMFHSATIMDKLNISKQQKIAKCQHFRLFCVRENR